MPVSRRSPLTNKSTLLGPYIDRLTQPGGLDQPNRIIEHLLKVRAISVMTTGLELNKHQAHGIKLIGERVLPALREAA